MIPVGRGGQWRFSGIPVCVERRGSRADVGTSCRAARSSLYLLLPSIIGRAQATHMASQTLCGSGFVDCRGASAAIAREWPGMRTLTQISGERMVLYRVDIER